MMATDPQAIAARPGKVALSVRVCSHEYRERRCVTTSRRPSGAPRPGMGADDRFAPGVKECLWREGNWDERVPVAYRRRGQG